MRQFDAAPTASRFERSACSASGARLRDAIAAAVMPATTAPIIATILGRSLVCGRFGPLPLFPAPAHYLMTPFDSLLPPHAMLCTTLFSRQRFAMAGLDQ